MRADFELTPQMRASDADRDVAADRLRVAAGDGRLDADELDDRLSEVYGARWCSELIDLTADVTPPPVVAARPVFVNRPPARLNPLAVASVLCSLIWLGGLGAAGGLVLGVVALKQIHESEEPQLGRSLALIGIAIGFVGLLALLAWSGLAWRGADWD